MILLLLLKENSPLDSTVGNSAHSNSPLFIAAALLFRNNRPQNAVIEYLSILQSCVINMSLCAVAGAAGALHEDER